MAIYLYQSKKVQRYLGQRIYTPCTSENTSIDPLLIWHADVFFIDRQRYIVVTNPWTKLTFIIFRYSQKSHPDFLDTFKEKLALVLRAADINPELYFKQFELIHPYLISDKSASSHLSRIKREYEYMICARYHGVMPPDDEVYYNAMLADDFASFHKNDLDKTSGRFLNELLLRRWVL